MPLEPSRPARRSGQAAAVGPARSAGQAAAVGPARSAGQAAAVGPARSAGQAAAVEPGSLFFACIYREEEKPLLLTLDHCQHVDKACYSKGKTKTKRGKNMTNVGMNVKAGLSSLTLNSLMIRIQPVAKVVTFGPQMDYIACARIQSAAKLAIALKEVK